MAEQEPKFDKGLIFVKDRDVLLTGDKWSIVLEVAVDDYVQMIQEMKVVMKTIGVSIDTIFPVTLNPEKKIYTPEIARMNQLIRDIEVEVESFRALLPKAINTTVPGSRTKRGLVNIIGYVMKYLFGTIDHHDMENMNRFIDSMKVFATQVTHTTEQQLTYIQRLNDKVIGNTRNIVSMAKTLERYLKGRAVQEVQDRRRFGFIAGIRDMEMAIVQARQNLMQLQESLDMTALGKLSSTLVPPHNLTKMLAEIATRIPEGTSMIAPPIIENAWIYYQISTVHACATPEGIRLFIDIPLKGNDRYFEVYRPYSLPYFQKNINAFVSIRVPEGTYLAISTDRQSYAVLTHEDLNKCQSGYYTICPADFVILDAQAKHCLIALYTGKDDVVQQKCQRTIEDKNFDPIWVRSAGTSFWIYSLSARTRVTKKCKAHGPTVDFQPTTTLELAGTGVLNLSYNCFVYGPTFKLFPRSLGKSKFGIESHHIIIPAINHVLTLDEKEFFQDVENNPDLRDLRGIATQSVDGMTVGTDVTGLRAAALSMQQSSPINKTLIIVMLVLIILILIVVLLRHVLLKCIVRWWSRCQTKRAGKHLTEGQVIYASRKKQKSRKATPEREEEEIIESNEQEPVAAEREKVLFVKHARV